MPCTEFDDMLAAYAELTPAERERVDSHLQFCPACQSWFEALSEIDAALGSRFARCARTGHSRDGRPAPNDCDSFRSYPCTD